MNYAAVPAVFESVELEFDRVLQAITEGTNRFQGLTVEEVAQVTTVLGEKRTEYEAARASMPHYPSRFSGRVQSILTADPRVKAIFDIRLQRRRIVPDGPIRYLGFSTTPEWRVFRFGRLPSRDANDLFQIRIAHVFFAPQHISLQEGPGFCASILCDRGNPSDYEVTAEDVQDFIAKKPVKTSKRQAFVAKAPSV
jgi:hypothetical protein